MYIYICIYIGRVEGVEDFSSAYYFIFITWSTIGFGDYATEGAFFYVIAVMGLVLFAALMSALGMSRYICIHIQPPDNPISITLDNPDDIHTDILLDQ